ncbi:MAG TPA: glutamate synthase, partial [Polyangia bacterium]
MSGDDDSDRLLATRSEVYREDEPNDSDGAARSEEGGCGVTGFACNIPVRGKFIHEPSIQMQNRGNGKGGGIAAVGLVPEQLGVSREVLDTNYLLHVAFIDTKVRSEIEQQFIHP